MAESSVPGAVGEPPLAETMTRLADSPRSRWHDDVLPNGAGDSWVCVPIGDVLNALPAGSGGAVGEREEHLDVLNELAAYAKSHKMLRAGHGNTDDVLAFIDWYRAADWTLETARLSVNEGGPNR